MSRLIDLTGQRFGRLTVIKRVDNSIQPSGQQKAQWLCKCDCGNEHIVKGYSLKNGDTKSCGCLNSEIASESIKRFKKENTYDLSGNYGIGYTANGKKFYFDLEDYDKIKNYYWQVTKRGYVISSETKEHDRLVQHRLIMNCPEELEIDHIHQERKNDNRKNNLRICTHIKNSMNRDIRSDNTSGVTGVSFDKHCNKWVAMITYNGKRKKRKFSDFSDAVRQRKEWEELYFSEYSYNNSQMKEVV